MNKKYYITVPSLFLLLGVGWFGFKFSYTSDKNSGLAISEGTKSDVTFSGVNSSDSTKENVSISDSSIKNAVANDTDRRLANLIVEKDNPMVEYVYDEGGFIIKEIDKEPSSISYKKPLKLYQYKNGKVVKIEKYEYFSTETHITTIDAAFNDDGSIQDYRETINSSAAH